jgi:RHS repeat-associated protein
VRYFRHADQRVLRFVQKGQVRVLTVYLGPFEYHNRAGGSVEYSKVVLHVQGEGRHAQVEQVLDGSDPDSLDIFYHHGDQLGSGHVLTDENGELLSQEEYFPYGRSSDRRDARNRYRFIGVERDEDTGMCMTGPRQYDPVMGRFLEGDPLVQPGGTPFGYAGGGPVGWMDPGGYQAEPAEVAMPATTLPTGGVSTDSLENGADSLRPGKEQIATIQVAEKLFTETHASGVQWVEHPAGGRYFKEVNAGLYGVRGRPDVDLLFGTPGFDPVPDDIAVTDGDGSVSLSPERQLSDIAMLANRYDISPDLIEYRGSFHIEGSKVTAKSNSIGRLLGNDEGDGLFSSAKDFNNVLGGGRQVNWVLDRPFNGGKVSTIGSGSLRASDRMSIIARSPAAPQPIRYGPATMPPQTVQAQAQFAKDHGLLFYYGSGRMLELK